MLTQEEMVRIRLYVHEKFFDKVALELGRLSVLHVVDVRGENEDFGGHVSPIELSERYHKLRYDLSKVEGVMSRLDISLQGGEPAGLEEEKAAEIIEDVEKSLEAGRTEEEVASQYGEALKKVFTFIQAGMKMEEFRSKCGKTKRVIVVEGWMPKNRMDSTYERLKNVSEGKVTLTTLSQEEEEPPSKITFPEGFQLLKTFSKLTTGFSFPGYKEINPTVFQLVSYPIIFGFMFGDFGQGLILFAFGLLMEYARRKGLKFGGELGDMVIQNGLFISVIGLLATIIGLVNYGVVFGSPEWGHTVREAVGLGFLNEHEVWNVNLGGIKVPLVFEPLHHPTKLLILSIFIGCVHISLGLIISLINHIRRKEYRDLLIGPGIRLWLYWGGIVYLFFFIVLREGLAEVFTMNAMLLLFLPFTVMLVFQLKFHGMDGMAESLEAILTSISHTISYARILALNLAHEVFNLIFLTAGAALGMAGIIAAVVLGSIAVLLLEGILSLIHTLRLHWVEWFTKFYHGDGVEYTPFSIY